VKITYFAVLNFRLHSRSCTIGLDDDILDVETKSQTITDHKDCVVCDLKTSTYIFRIGYSNFLLNNNFCVCAFIAYLTGVNLFIVKHNVLSVDTTIVLI